MLHRQCAVLVLAMAAIPLTAREASAYGVLAHEAVVDAAWDRSIAPVLRSRFHPSNAELAEARSYAYGGCLIQDLGYYPFSSRLFGDLTHYVRSGDFVAALLKDSRNINEYAFALGALAHYAADNNGHPLAINPSVALLYPKLRARYGHNVTYEDSPSAHLKTEFAFDVVQVARAAYRPAMYHDFIGFHVSEPLLERAFRDTYGIELKDVFADLDLAVGTFRYAVGSMIPKMTKVAWQSRQDEIEQLSPGISREKFLFGLSRSSYEQDWGTEYERPGFGSKVLAFVIRILPKIGPLRSLSFKMPTPEAERLFISSFDATTRRYVELLRAASQNRLVLANRNFDTAQVVKAGEYQRADHAYVRLLEKLEDNQFHGVSSALRDNLLAFFAVGNASRLATGDPKQWQKIQTDLKELRALSAN